MASSHPMHGLADNSIEQCLNYDFSLIKMINLIV